MTVFSAGPFIRRAALAAATVFAMPVTAQEQITPVAAQPLKKIDPNSAYNIYFRDILIMIGHDLRQPISPQRSISMRNNVLMLQQSLNHYAQEKSDLGLVAVEEDGILGRDTAFNILQVIHEEGIIEALSLPGTAAMTTEDAAALKAASDLLATLQPLAYADKLRAVIVAPPEDIERNMLAMTVVMRQTFRECTAWDRKILSADVVEKEINEIAARAGHISQFIQVECAEILHRLPDAEREAAQTEYLNARKKPEEKDEDKWCKVRQDLTCLQFDI